MDYLFYKLFNIKSKYLLDLYATKIQKCYRNYKMYQYNIRFDTILRKKKSYISDFLIDYNNKIELDYWNYLRYKIKNNTSNEWIIL